MKKLSTTFKQIPNNTHNKKHEGTRRPSKSNKVAITAEEQSTQHSENHPERQRQKEFNAKQKHANRLQTRL